MCDNMYDSDSSNTVIQLKSMLSYEFTSPQCYNTSVRGRLALCYDQWVKLGASGFILSVIREGYKILFVSIPPPKVSANNSSALKHKEFVFQAITDLLRSRCVEPLHHIQTNN